MDIEFASSSGPSLGIELELTLVDQESLGLVSAASELLTELGKGHPAGEHPRVKHELFECTIEIITGVCTTVREAQADLQATLGEVRDAAERRGLTVMAIGTHPFAGWRQQVVSPNPRYHELLDEMQWTARRLLIFGTHFHVGVRSAEKSIAIATALQAYLPHFLMLSASSPYWEREDSGLASSRIKVFESLPTAGLPPRLANWHEFEEFMETLIQAGCIKTIREVWWDIRPHPNFGTVELRMCDAIPTLKEAAALAALAQCLVQSLDDRFDDGTFPGAPREWTVRENKWLAARHGTDADLIVDNQGTRRPARELITELVQQLEPVASHLDCETELEDVLGIVEEGPSYLRQRRIVQAGGDGKDIVRAAIAELASGLSTDARKAP
ncbi:MAG: glutamate--cysteine ligase [Actinobacteria bacterium]|nr:glutamate--cysteine ligase [Actinomycetota bacterium]